MLMPLNCKIQNEVGTVETAGVEQAGIVTAVLDSDQTDGVNKDVLVPAVEQVEKAGVVDQMDAG